VNVHERQHGARRSPLRYETLASCSSPGNDVYRSIGHAGDVKIGIVTESFLPGINGVTNSVLRILEHFRARGHEAMVVAPGEGPTEYAGAPVVRVPAVPLPVYRSFPVALPTRQVESALRDFQPDVVHLASPAVLCAMGAVASRRLDVPVVAVFQSDLVGFARRYRLGLVGPALWGWLRWIHRHAALSLAPSSVVAWELERRGITPVARWARGVDVDQFKPAHRSELLRRHLAPRGEVVVGYVGRLAAEKQVERLGHLTDLPGTRLVIVGDGPLRPRLERRLPRARFLGFRTGGDLSATLASMDVFVHPGEAETFCQAVQEALASAVPVVAPAAGGPLDLIRHGVNGWLFPARRPDLLRGAVAEVAADPTARAAMGRAARVSVEERTWPRLCDELLGHYGAVLGVDVRRARAA
jgi:phosphatidylinositol alpha 1,6-mannosyltransferase